MKDIDGVMVASPLHIHFRHFVDTLAGGKDLYAGKTMTWSIAEAEKCLNAARNSERVIEIGPEHQSGGPFADAKKWISDGIARKVTLVDAWMSRNTPPLARAGSRYHCRHAGFSKRSRRQLAVDLQQRRYGLGQRILGSHGTIEYVAGANDMVSGASEERIRYYPEHVNRPNGAPLTGESPTSRSQGELIECIRSRSTPNAPAELGYRSAVACHMAHLSYRQKRRVTCDEAKAFPLEF